jgi:glycosyltransferase involved in cell wall biosynthesis
LKKKILIGHPYWGRSGAEISAINLIGSVQDNNSVYIITRGGFNLKELNELAESDVDISKITILKLPFHWILKQTKGGAIWHAIFLRYCRYIAPKYDFVITASRTIGWGVPAIHFLSDVVWNDELNQRYGESTKSGSFVKMPLQFIGKLLSGKARYELHPKDVFVANSKWTAEISKPYTTSTPVVIYPPVTAEFTPPTFSSRNDEFVMMGRISPEKRIEDAIEIIKEVRATGINVGLTIYGAFNGSSYAKKIKHIAQNHSWIKTPGTIYGKNKATLLPQFKYGINTCQREAFGISTAEMLKAGIVTFVPEQGAQKELIKKKNYIFESKEDAVSKIINFLKLPDSEKKEYDVDLISQKLSKERFKKLVNSLLKQLSCK